MITVTAAILRHEGLVLLARRKDGKHAGRWEFPGGKLEDGESEPQCLARELQEELGIETEVDAFFAESFHTYDGGAIRLRAYEVRWVSGELRPQVHDRLEWVRPENVRHYDLLSADLPLAEALRS